MAVTCTLEPAAPMMMADRWPGKAWLPERTKGVGVSMLTALGSRWSSLVRVPRTEDAQLVPLPAGLTLSEVSYFVRSGWM